MRPLRLAWLFNINIFDRELMYKGELSWQIMDEWIEY